MKYEFEKKLFDKGIMTLKFKVNYWFLKKLGLTGFGIWAFIWGVIITIIIYEFILN